jgi:hypothetical protein
MAVTLSPAAVEESIRARRVREGSLIRTAAGFKVTAIGPAAKLFTGCGWG